MQATTNALSPLPSKPGATSVVALKFESRDPDETYLHVTRWGDHYRKVHGTGFFYRESMYATSRLALGRFHREFHQTLRAATRQHSIAVDLQPGQTFFRGRRHRWELGPTCAVLCAPGQEYMRRGSPGDCIMLSLNSDLLEESLARLARRSSRRWLVQTTLLPLSPQRLAELVQFEQRMRQATHDTQAGTATFERLQFERVVADWLAEWILECAAARSMSQTGMHRIEQLERWVDAHLGEGLTLEQLCRVARLSPRSLQKAMLVARGVTPFEMVQQRRLAAARRRLLAPGPDERVSNVALDCGFQHLGRFSLSYRAAFGESPRDTLAPRGPAQAAVRQGARNPASRT